ncbi:MAG TPA: halocarboxylic acid dehydrogenase DehI family protein [Sandaracinaceae bacterium LLY-WYZ-13_1]|nr:halocarboxylic acid dehydrogenase DehI family protein [Sandaracinaceae bacterium LLY-WYZ-13_1]
MDDSSFDAASARIRALGRMDPAEVDADLAALFDDVRQTLRVPVVDDLIRTLATERDVLARRWRAVRPVLGTLAFERAADALREEALLPSASEIAGTGTWADWPRADELRHYTETTQYVAPKLLLIATAWDTGRTEPAPGVVDGAAPIPTRPPSSTERLPPTVPDTAEPATEERLDAVRERHGHPRVPDYFRAIARFEGFFEAAWTTLEPFVGGDAARERRAQLVARAEALIAPLFVPAGAPETALHEVVAAHRHRILPDVLIDVTTIRAWLDGPEAARVAPPSAALPVPPDAQSQP